MSQKFKPSKEIINNSYIDSIKYDEMYEESIKSPEDFWFKNGRRIDWIKPYSQIKDVTYSQEKVDIKSNEKTFFAVRVNRYKSKRKAEEIGKDIKSKLGVSYRVLYRPL